MIDSDKKKETLKLRMTKKEFYAEYLRLHQTFPHQFMISQPSQLAELFGIVEQFKVSWLRSKIDRMIKNNDPSISIREAALGEIKSQAAYERAIKATQDTTPIDYDSLTRVLEKEQAPSLWDLVLKYKTVSG